MSCGVGHRWGSDLVLLWLWHRPAAVALIRPLAWAPPDAIRVALTTKPTQTHTHKPYYKILLEDINKYVLLQFSNFNYYDL